jgi:uncharacterized protein YwqG
LEKLTIPQELEKYREQIEATKKSYIKIEGTLKEELSLWESKFGGNPYFPLNEEYPKDNYGKPLKMIAQINFEEVPEYENFPRKGILQFYISAEDEEFGIDFDNRLNQENFRVIYFKDIIYDTDQLITDFSFLDVLDLDEYPVFPVLKESKLQFIQNEEFVSDTDYQFYEYFDDEIERYEYDIFTSCEHKMGGYAHFTQKDPRYTEYQDYNILLFQMVSNLDLGISWLDSGVANFFMKQEDLRNLDFSKVMFHWDTY